MKPATRTILVAVLLALSGSSVTCARQSATRRDAFSVLHHKTGWVRLGLLDARSRQLVSPDSFEVVGRQSGQPMIPNVNDRIRTTGALPVVIIGYGITLEDRRLVSPTTRRELDPVDQTDLEISPGSVVEVRDVQISETDGQVRQVWARVAQPGQKPVVVDEFEIDRMAPPATLGEMWRAAGAVAVLKMLNSARRPAAPDPLMLRPRLGYDTTTYEANVVEVLKSDPPCLSGAGAVVRVHRENGDTDEGDLIIRRIERDFPAFIIGDEYVLFLEWSEYARLFVPAYGPDASYDITSGVIETSGGGAVARSLNGKPAEHLLTRLRALKKQSAK